MHFDINAAQANLDQWDFGVTVNGETFPTREITLQEYNDLVKVGAMNADQQIDTLAGMFKGNPPPVRDWTADVRDLVYNAIGAYLNEHLEKKRLAVRRMVRTAMNTK